MKRISYICYSLSLLVLLASCLKDKGNYSYTTVPALYVDTVGKQTRFEVYQSQDKLHIEPAVVYEGDVSQLTHLWRLYAANNAFDTLSKRAVVDTVITRPPGTYTVEYEATDRTGLKALMQYTVVVTSATPSGWMVAYENAEGNTDVDLIRSALFMTGSPDVVLRNIYSGRNGAALPGKPVSVLYVTTGLGYLFTNTTGVKVQNTDFAFAQNFSQIFLLNNPPAVVKPEAFWLGSFNQGILVNNGDVYWASENSLIGKVTVDAKGYRAAPFVYQQYAKQGGFYDQLNRRFIIIEQQTSQATTFTNASGSARFNLNNIGKELLFIERGFGQNDNPVDPYKYAIFRDPDGAGRYLYVINFQAPASPDVAAIDISSAPDIQDARFYAVGNLGPAAFYGTSSKVYNYQVNSAGNSITTPVVGFTAPAGEEITCMKLFKGHGTFGVGAPTANDSKFMYVATWNEGQQQGKVYLLSANITSGELGATPLATWIVGGKVGDMSYKIQ
ncbi:MAG: PKD-like family lipoprotein [Candidatus Pseudobacter hemicellulosilyticus]|uniref:PKD-like family lipoprotein n=1 Tax=Candidatus Pseudobacter hemicellulosilyticus TaxID=3121375 RepID=A0AAJ6BGT4_9BACT|nr:MAG: PKD-like family lipoprotein [Pseudobacter sp.]